MKLHLSWDTRFDHWVNWGWENGIARIGRWWQFGPITLSWVRWERGGERRS